MDGDMRGGTPVELDEAAGPPPTARDRVLRGLRRHGPAVLSRAARLVVWGVVHFVFGLVQQVAEIAAPLLLVVGIGWWALPRAIAVIQTDDGGMHDILNGLEAHIPTALALGGLTVTPGGLVVDGLLLMALAAALSTASALLSRELFRR